MAEALIPNVSLALLKEVYLLGRVVVRTAKTGLHHDSERSQLLEELDREHLFVKTFAVNLYERNGMLINNESINQQWLSKINVILENYRTALKDYTVLAAKRDEAYQQFSPYLLTEEPQQQQIEFPEFDQRIQELESNGETGILALNPEPNATAVVPAAGDKVKKRPAFDLKFALFDKKKLEKILGKQQECRQQLLDILQLTVAFNINRPASRGPSDSTDSDAILGLTSHNRVLRLNEAVEVEDITLVNLQAEGYKLELPHRINGLALAHLRSSGSNPADRVHRSSDTLVEEKEINGESDDTRTENEDRITALAKVLLASDSNLGTLPLKGYWPGKDSIYFVFNFPENVIPGSPVSLYDLIRRGDQISLPLRFHIAHRMAKTLAALHADKWVHKSFRSQSIAFFRLLNGKIDFKKPYLVNFEYARALDTITKWDSDDDPEKNIYRHPDRQNAPRVSFNKSHDLYALGVVLLEIGLWKTAAKIKQEIQSNLGDDLDPELLKDKFIERASRDLPHSMGPAYASATKTCLQGSFEIGVDDPGFSFVVQDRIVEKVGVDALDQED